MQPIAFPEHGNTAPAWRQIGECFRRGAAHTVKPEAISSRNLWDHACEGWPGSSFFSDADRHESSRMKWVLVRPGTERFLTFFAGVEQWLNS